MAVNLRESGFEVWVALVDELVEGSAHDSGNDVVLTENQMVEVDGMGSNLVVVLASLVEQENVSEDEEGQTDQGQMSGENC